MKNFTINKFWRILIGGAVLLLASLIEPALPLTNFFWKYLFWAGMFAAGILISERVVTKE